MARFNLPSVFYSTRAALQRRVTTLRLLALLQLTALRMDPGLRRLVPPARIDLE